MLILDNVGHITHQTEYLAIAQYNLSAQYGTLLDRLTFKKPIKCLYSYLSGT